MFPVKFDNVGFFSEQSEITNKNVKLRYFFFLRISEIQIFSIQALVWRPEPQSGSYFL